MEHKFQVGDIIKPINGINDVTGTIIGYTGTGPIVDWNWEYNKEKPFTHSFRYIFEEFELDIKAMFNKDLEALLKE